LELTYKEIKQILETLGLKIRKVPWGYLITRASDGGEFGNFDSLYQVELFLYDYHGM
jgi:hypothetical protein